MISSQRRVIAQVGLVVSIGALLAFGISFALSDGVAPVGVAAPVLLMWFSLLLLKRARAPAAQARKAEGQL